MRVPDNFLEGEIRNSFYVESMMKKVWAAQLEVLHEIDRICKKHNITYFADWGTLLGAVRHKGFIPWDDDMDITMKRQDYIKFARAKGVPAKSVLFGHALKNALIPVITIFGMNLGSMIAFTTITETIFAWPGMGTLIIKAAQRRDFPVVQYGILMIVIFVSVVNFAVDLSYGFLDPRIRDSRDNS